MRTKEIPGEEQLLGIRVPNVRQIPRPLGPSSNHKRRRESLTKRSSLIFLLRWSLLSGLTIIKSALLLSTSSNNNSSLLGLLLEQQLSTQEGEADQRRTTMRRSSRSSTTRTSVRRMLALLPYSLLVSSASAFVAPSPTTSFARPTTSALQALSLDEIIYNAGSTANDLATSSLSSDHNLLQTLPLLYAAGLLTSVSPCVWGLLPLTMSYISNAAGERADQQTTLPTLAFAGGLATVFCSLGVAAAELGGVFGSSGGTVWTGVLSNGICLAMGLKLLELVELPLPSLNVLREEEEPLFIDANGQVMQSKRKQREGGSLVRTFLLGGSSALVASPCATPVLTSILAYVAQAHNAGLGALLLLGYTLGYSTPLLLVASTGGKALVEIKNKKGWYSEIAPWITPLTGGILLWYGTNGLLTSILGDPSMLGLPIIE